MTAVGDGVVNFSVIVKAGHPYTEWLIVELDRCATDMAVAVKQSLDYLVANELGYSTLID